MSTVTFEQRAVRIMRGLAPENQPALWRKYGLSIMESIRFTVDDKELLEIMKMHWRVARYLDSHPEAAEKYKNDQTGELRYYDILRLAGG